MDNNSILTNLFSISQVPANNTKQSLCLYFVLFIHYFRSLLQNVFMTLGSNAHGNVVLGVFILSFCLSVWIIHLSANFNLALGIDFLSVKHFQMTSIMAILWPWPYGPRWLFPRVLVFHKCILLGQFHFPEKKALPCNSDHSTGMKNTRNKSTAVSLYSIIHENLIRRAN